MGEESRESEGRLQQAKDKAEELLDDARDAAGKLVDRAREEIAERRGGDEAPAADAPESDGFQAPPTAPVRPTPQE